MNSGAIIFFNGQSGFFASPSSSSFLSVISETCGLNENRSQLIKPQIQSNGNTYGAGATLGRAAFTEMGRSGRLILGNLFLITSCTKDAMNCMSSNMIWDGVCFASTGVPFTSSCPKKNFSTKFKLDNSLLSNAVTNAPRKGDSAWPLLLNRSIRMK